MVLSVLAWVLLDRLERELQSAEARSVAMVLVHLRSALVIKGAELMLDRHQSLANAEGGNPFLWLEHRWDVYQGPCGHGGPAPGNWCFQPQRAGGTDKGWLIYRPRQPITVEGKAVEAGQPVAWVVTTGFADRNRNNVREQNERLTGLVLESVPLQATRANRQDARL
ncbi:hypothetical protein C7H09_14240 [Marinobacter fuscus]|uniref:Uncharacterized protein n=2 Tax=Marinobacter fuscus TaxID=2109942 RepID=A0A2T1K615_9GAMM|nr:hypothetical protein C7H09_14240 [Marinobacter fuscus]